jgi:hypothetical protein
VPATIGVEIARMVAIVFDTDCENWTFPVNAGKVRQTAPDLAQQQRQERSVPDELRAMVRQAVAQVRHATEQARAAWRHDRGQGLSR